MMGRGPAKRVFVAVAVRSLVGFSSDRRVMEYTPADASAYWDGACGVDTERPRADSPFLRACILFSTRLHINVYQHESVSRKRRK